MAPECFGYCREHLHNFPLVAPTSEQYEFRQTDQLVFVSVTISSLGSCNNLLVQGLSRDVLPICIPSALCIRKTLPHHFPKH